MRIKEDLYAENVPDSCDNGLVEENLSYFPGMLFFNSTHEFLY